MNRLLYIIPTAAIMIGLFTSSLHAQNAAASPKPGIYINGTAWLIQNTIYSCATRNCDSLIILTGDSVEFCTGQQISLNTDSAYYMDWHFNGSANYPFPFRDSYPSALPICYNPIWNYPGVYTVDVYYNGWLSAYPQSDCYAFGPSHWTLNIHVFQNPNHIAELEEHQLEVYPNPTTGIIHLSGLPVNAAIHVYNAMGQLQFHNNETTIDCTSWNSGVYYIYAIHDTRIYRARIIKE